MSDSDSQQQQQHEHVEEEQVQRRLCVSRAICARAIELVIAEQWLVKEVVEALGVNRNTRFTILHKYKESGFAVCPRPRGRAPLLAPAIKEKLCDWVDEDCALTLQELCNLVLTTFGIAVLKQTVMRSLKDFHFSFKRTSLLPDRRNCHPRSSVVACAHEFVRLLPSRRKLVFMDEVEFPCSLHVRQDLDPAGSCANVRVGAVRTQNYIVAAAIMESGLLHSKATKGAYNTDRFTAFVDDIVTAPAAGHINGAIVVMNNVAFYKAAVIRNSLLAFGYSVMSRK